MGGRRQVAGERSSGTRRQLTEEGRLGESRGTATFQAPTSPRGSSESEKGTNAAHWMSS